jgi:hypothetical protein
MEHLQRDDGTLGDGQDTHRFLVEAMQSPCCSEAPHGDDLVPGLEEHLTRVTITRTLMWVPGASEPGGVRDGAVDTPILASVGQGRVVPDDDLVRVGGEE